MKELTVIFLCTWKFAATFPLAVYVMNMTFLETIIYANTGGALGVIVFAFLSHFLIKLYEKYWLLKLKYHRSHQKIFNRRNRWLVKIKNGYGLSGIVILTPILLSIPVGTFLITKYYGGRKTNFLWLILGQIAWSLVFTAFYTRIKTMF